MKSRRRKDLQTNELAQTLSQLNEAFNRYGTYILAGVAVVMVVIVSVWYTTYAREGSRQRAWERRYMLSETPDLQQRIAGYRQLAETGKDKMLSATGWLQLGRTAWDEAHTPEVINNADRWDELLQTAEQAFRKVTEMSGVSDEMVQAARSGLAAIAIERHDPKSAKEQYQQILDMKDSSYTGYGELAEKGLASAADYAEPVAFAPPLPTAPAPTPATPPAVPAGQVAPGLVQPGTTIHPTVRQVSPDELPPALRERAARQRAGQAEEKPAEGEVPVGPFLNPSKPEPVQPTTMPVAPTEPEPTEGK